MRPARLVAVTPVPTYPPAQPSPVRASWPTEADQSRGHPQHPAPGVVDRGVAGGREEGAQQARQRRDRLRVGHAVGVGAASRSGRGRPGRRRRCGRRRSAGRRCRRARGRRAPRGRASRSRSQTSAGSGSVTTRLEFIGSSVRRSPWRPGVKPSVARITWRARTSPRPVRARPSSMAVTTVSSWIVTPSRSTAAASPGTSLAGWRVAQWGCQSAPTAPATWRRAAVALASSSTVSVSGQVASAAALARSRPSWAALRATSSSPPRMMSASMPSRGGDLDHPGDRRVERPLLRDRRPAVAAPDVLLAAAGDAVGQPAAVAPRGAVPGEPRLQHDDPQVRPRALQVVGRPQPGVAGADDAHVGVGRAGQRRAGRRRTDLAPPERHPAVGRPRSLAPHGDDDDTSAVTSPPDGPAGRPGRAVGAYHRARWIPHGQDGVRPRDAPLSEAPRS